jgi:hypothetical protein
MTHDSKLAEYSRQRLGGRKLPDDLRTLLVLQWQRGVTAAGADPLDEMGEHAAFVARDDDDRIIGYWFGPENVGIDAAPILRLDTEGQFALLEGGTLSEALLGSHVFDDAERFTQLKEEFAKAGIAISAGSWDELAYPHPPTDPAEFHERHYEENQVKG